MPRLVLVRHPDTPCTAIHRVEAELGADARGAVCLHYRMLGDANLVVASPAAGGEHPRRRDGLWRHTCCELFVRDAAGDGDGYSEFNFAPCGDWGAYRFSGYRTGMQPLETAAPRIALERAPAFLELRVTLPDQPFEAFRARRIGVACIVETATELSYWAPAHPPGRPDFHHACTFALQGAS